MGYLLLTQAPGLRQTDFNHSATENGGVTERSSQMVCLVSHT